MQFFDILIFRRNNLFSNQPHGSKLEDCYFWSALSNDQYNFYYSVEFNNSDGANKVFWLGTDHYFLGGGDENFFKTNNFFLCCCLCKQFFFGCIFLQTIFCVFVIIIIIIIIIIILLLLSLLLL